MSAEAQRGQVMQQINSREVPIRRNTETEAMRDFGNKIMLVFSSKEGQVGDAEACEWIRGYKSSPEIGLHFACAGFLPPHPTFYQEKFQTYRTVERIVQ